MQSHESIISLSNGMDIHTLNVRPSQLTLRPLGLSAAGTNVSAVTARPTISRGASGNKRGSVVLRDNLSGLQVSRTRGDGRPHSRGGIGAGLSRKASTLGRIVSWRPWSAAGSNASGASPPTSPLSQSAAAEEGAGPCDGLGLASADAVSSAPKSIHTASSQGSLTSSTTVATGGTLPFRAPGINQPGMIPGFSEYFAKHARKGPPSKVSLDGGQMGQIREAMREVLDE